MSHRDISRKLSVLADAAKYDASCSSSGSKAKRAGLQRSDLYITNAVKHFRFLYKDSFRQHQPPSRYQVQACKPWLNAEIVTIQPSLIVCLGNTLPAH